jgi:hypothetical protein
MYILLQLLPVERLAYEQAPALGLAWIIAELFYKFHIRLLYFGEYQMN